MAIKILLLIFALSITTFGTTYVQCRYCGQKIFRVKDKYEMEFNVDKMMKMKYFYPLDGNSLVNPGEFVRCKKCRAIQVNPMIVHGKYVPLYVIRGEPKMRYFKVYQILK